MKGLIRLGENGEKNKQKNKKNNAMSAALAASSAKKTRLGSPHQKAQLSLACQKLGLDPTLQISLLRFYILLKIV